MSSRTDHHDKSYKHEETGKSRKFPPISTRFTINQNVKHAKKGPQSIKRDLDPNGIVIRRRFGEGSKPIFHSVRSNLSPKKQEKPITSRRDRSSSFSSSSSSSTISRYRTKRRSRSSSNHKARKDIKDVIPEKAKPPLVRSTAEKIPYFTDTKRETDRIRRLYGASAKQHNNNNSSRSKYRSRSRENYENRSRDRYNHRSRTSRRRSYSRRRSRSRDYRRSRSRDYRRTRNRDSRRSRSYDNDRRYRRRTRSRSKQRNDYRTETIQQIPIPVPVEYPFVPWMPTPYRYPFGLGPPMRPPLPQFVPGPEYRTFRFPRQFRPRNV